MINHLISSDTEGPRGVYLPDYSYEKVAKEGRKNVLAVLNISKQGNKKWGLAEKLVT